MSPQPKRKLHREDDVLEVLKRLPRYCFAVQPSEPKMVILLHRGVPGYTPFRIKTTEIEAADYASHMNGRKGITPAQAEAMLAGSMWGWHTPAADPLNYLDDLAMTS